MSDATTDARGLNKNTTRTLPCLVATMLWLCVQCVGAQTIAPGRTITSTQLGPANPGWSPSQVEVFATNAMYIHNAERAMVYRVDGRKQLMQDINQGGLPPNPQVAANLVRQRVQAMGPEFYRRVQSALLAVEKTMVYGVQRLPAVVLDGQRVVYGVTDVAIAVDIVRRGGGQPIGARFVPGRRSSTPSPERRPSNAVGTRRAP